MKRQDKKWFVAACGTTAAIVLTGAASLILAGQAAATPEFAAQTKQACSVCHTDPKGGGALTAAGEKFKANGNKLTQ